MKNDVKKIAMAPLRYVARQVLQRPLLKKKIRGMLTRMPRLHRLLLRALFRGPAPVQRKTVGGMKKLSPHTRRTHRALQQAIRQQRR